DNSNSGGFADLEVSAAISDGTNDLVSVVTNKVFVPPANETYAYDADGNQTLVTTGTGAWQVEYNGENRPVRWTRISPDSPTPNSSTPTLISMAFDHQGRRRLYVEVAAGVTNKLHRFTYDDYVCIARNREVDAQHGIGSDAFVWDPTEPIATRPLMCDLSGGGALLYCHDGNKNVSEAVTPDGTIAAHYEYSSFGKVLLVSSENADQSLAYLNPYRFSSECADDALGLVYYNYRHYNPRDGRWMSRDPIGDDGGVHLYAFCENNPLSCVDSLGYALANYIPVISTILSAIENSFGHIPGSLPSDYSFVSPKDCKCDIIAAENNCLAKVKTEAWKYLGDYATTALIARGLDLVITILTIKIQIVAAVFVADGLIGGAINVSAGTKIMEGASNAKKNNCDCSQHGY
ncbi:MAG: hypothetical protein IJG84_10065, partial [Kiritimatiellae bacterium]|nr:hypothetical protein [Kiritimatiellia bacterium]